MSSILFMPNPKHFLDSLVHNKQDENLKIDGNKITITITRDSTVNSIGNVLKNNSDSLNRAIKDIRNKVKETELEVHFLERDYKAYKIYSNYSAKDNKYSRDRKVDKVIEGMDDQKDLEKYNEGSIRKIASRMNQRIKSTFTDRQRTFESVLDVIEQSSQ